ncbi:MAG: FAD/NAD(P)-binding protein [Chloroflexi bacterium]|nr:FAD/NAD(P)-binding protein [Chloroflexota bacterium]
MANPLMPLPAQIIDVETEGKDTLTYTLAFKDKEVQRQYRYKAGQFNMVGFWGEGEAPISMSSDPAEHGYFQHTVKVLGNITRSMGRLKEGDIIGVRGPYGTCWPLEEAAARDILIVAGGIGFAPLRPVIEHIIGNPSVYGKLTVLFGAKTPQDILFTRDFDRWRSRPNVELVLTVDRVDGQKWEHNIGVVPTLFEKIKLDAKNTVAMLCGPEIMLRFCLVDLIKRGFPMNQLFISMERRMSCGTAQCGHCFFGPKFVCRDGPVFRFAEVYDLMGKGV